MSKYADLRVGDVIDVTNRMEIARISEIGIEPVVVGTRGDVRWLGHENIDRVTVVKKAARPVKVGDVLDGNQVRARMWKRGTVLIAGDQPLFLQSSGEWLAVSFDPNCYNDYNIPFENLGDNEELTVAYLP